MKDNCIFCKIIKGELPSSTLYEDDMFKVIMDLSPVSKGHALIIPKEHFDNLYELDDEYASKAMVVAKKLATGMTKALGADGFNLLQNNGEDAGQSVYHFHMHLLPRYKGDEALRWTPGETTPEEMDKIAKQVKEVL